jgi:type VI protein secretion system component VasK
MAQAILNRILDDIKTLDSGELLTVEQAIRAQMRPQTAPVYPELTPEQIEAANALLRETIITLSYTTGADNDSIDADLAREYGADYADLYRSGEEK